MSETASEIIAAVRDLGATLATDGGTIRWQKAGGLPDELLNKMKVNKPFIVATLVREQFVEAVVDRFAGRSWAGYPKAFFPELAEAGLPGWPWPEDRLKVELKIAATALLEHEIAVTIHDSGKIWAIQFKDVPGVTARHVSTSKEWK